MGPNLTGCAPSLNYKRFLKILYQDLLFFVMVPVSSPRFSLLTSRFSPLFSGDLSRSRHRRLYRAVNAYQHITGAGNGYFGRFAF